MSTPSPRPPITLDYLRRKRDIKPPRLLVYGTAGIGKTTLAAYAPNPILLPVEDGMGKLDELESLTIWDLIRTYAELEEAIAWLVHEDHDFQTVSLDSLDWLERIIWAETCERNGWKNIESPDYGKGYGAAIDVWKEVIDGFEALRNTRQMSVILLAHASIVNYKSPDTAPYDRFKPKLHESGKGNGANPLIQEMVDCIFFYNRRVAVTNDTQGTQKKGTGHNRAIGGNQRVILTEERPHAIAKNRYNMPDEILMPDTPEQAWSALAAHIPYFNRNQ